MLYNIFLPVAGPEILPAHLQKGPASGSIRYCKLRTLWTGAMGCLVICLWQLLGMTVAPNFKANHAFLCRKGKLIFDLLNGLINDFIGYAASCCPEVVQL